MSLDLSSKFFGYKKVNCSICIPEEINQILSDLPNKSGVITELLEENIDRILAGDLGKKQEYESGKIKNTINSIVKLQKLTIESEINTLFKSYEKKHRQSISELNVAFNKQLKEMRKRWVKEFYSALQDSVMKLINKSG